MTIEIIKKKKAKKSIRYHGAIALYNLYFSSMIHVFSLYHYNKILLIPEPFVSDRT